MLLIRQCNPMVNHGHALINYLSTIYCGKLPDRR